MIGEQRSLHSKNKGLASAINVHYRNALAKRQSLICLYVLFLHRLLTTGIPLLNLILTHSWNESDRRRCRSHDREHAR